MLFIYRISFYYGCWCWQVVEENKEMNWFNSNLNRKYNNNIIIMTRFPIQNLHNNNKNLHMDGIIVIFFFQRNNNLIAFSNHIFESNIRKNKRTTKICNFCVHNEIWIGINSVVLSTVGWLALLCFLLNSCCTEF